MWIIWRSGLSKYWLRFHLCHFPALWWNQGKHLICVKILTTCEVLFPCYKLNKIIISFCSDSKLNKKIDPTSKIFLEPSPNLLTPYNFFPPDQICFTPHRFFLTPHQFCFASDQIIIAMRNSHHAFEGCLLSLFHRHVHHCVLDLGRAACIHWGSHFLPKIHWERMVIRHCHGS